VTAKTKKKATTWRKTRTANLYEHIQSGRYYAVAWINGKQVFRSMGTDSAEHAKAKLPETLKEFAKMGRRKENALPPETTMEQLSERYLQSVRTSVKKKASTVLYREQTVKAIFRTWPDLKAAKPRDISEAQCLEWAKRFSTMKTVRGHNQKKERETTTSPTRYNNTVDTLRHIFEEAIEGGLIFENPATNIEKLKPRAKRLVLPSREQFRKLVSEIRSSGAWCARECGDLVEFLAYSGCRLREANHVCVEHFDLEKGTLWIEGDPVHSTKNSESRNIRMIPPLTALVKDILNNPRISRKPNDGENSAAGVKIRSEHRQGKNYLLVVTECQKAIDSASAKLKVPRITHHDLRHLFATRCIESGTDIPTVSRWLGHKDGGALCMKTYGHLRRDHEAEMAEKVSF
jgi:integrase